MRMKKAILHELELVRGIAILAVVLIHVTAESTVKLQQGSWSQLLYLSVNKLSNFAVPVFILLSGAVLFYRYRGDWSASKALDFYMKRIKFIVIPYLLWSFFYYMYNQWFWAGWRKLDFKLDQFAPLLLWGEASYHLYFMVIVIQLYLVFPLLMSLVERFPAMIHLLLLAALAVHVWVYATDQTFGGHRAAVALAYAGHFMIGAYVGYYYENAIGMMRRLTPALVLAAAAVGGAFVVMHRMKPAPAADWFELTFGVYGAIAGLALMAAAKYALLPLRGAKLVFGSIGAASFGIYLAHPAILSFVLMRVKLPSDPLLYHLSQLATFAAVLLLPYAAYELLRRVTRYAWVVFGR